MDYLESGVSVEVLSRTQYAHGGLRKMLDKLPPKLVDIDVHPARPAVVDFNEKLAAIKRSTAVPLPLQWRNLQVREIRRKWRRSTKTMHQAWWTPLMTCTKVSST